MLRVLDLFSGIGGFSLGLERTGGFQTVAFCEIDPFCRRVLAKHWPEVKQYEDVRTLTAETLQRDGITVDAICGGFPCQDISTAGRALALTASAAAYGQSTPVSLANYDPATSSWRTSQRCLVEGLAEFSETWPRSGLMRNGIVYQLPPLVRLTDEIASGSWPTMTRADADGRTMRMKSSDPNYREDGRHSVTLERAVWQTPSVQDAHGRDRHNQKDGSVILSLLGEARMWPTPNAGDYKAGMSNAPNRKQSSLPRSVGIAEGVSTGKRGGLNPTWVEWLMGFPTKWTALALSETRSSRKSRS